MPAFAWTRAKNEKHLNVKLAPGTVETDESESQHLNTKPVRSQVRARAGATAVERCADAACVLPCCYGYATTFRRAQEASLDQGIYFEQKKYPAGRGYAYVARNRFRTHAGCHLNGNLRRSDFLPVGEDKEDEQLERGYHSLNSSDSEHDGAEKRHCIRPRKGK